MGEDASARTERELAELRGRIGQDVSDLRERVREDVDPRNVVRRQPLAVLGSLGSIAAAAAIGITRKARASRSMDGQLDALVERFGGRIDKLKGDARKRFRTQLRKEMTEVERTGPKEIAVETVAGALTAMATTMAQGFAKRLLGDEPGPDRRR